MKKLFLVLLLLPLVLKAQQSATSYHTIPVKEGSFYLEQAREVPGLSADSILHFSRLYLNNHFVVSNFKYNKEQKTIEAYCMDRPEGFGPIGAMFTVQAKDGAYTLRMYNVNGRGPRAGGYTPAKADKLLTGEREVFINTMRDNFLAIPAGLLKYLAGLVQHSN